MPFLCKAVNETYFSLFFCISPTSTAQLRSSDCVINLYFFALLIHLVILLGLCQGSSVLCLILPSVGFPCSRLQH